MALRKIKLGKYICQSDEKNSNLELSIENVRGISTQKIFIDTKANMEGVSLKNYKIVRPNQFVYVPDTSRRGDKISLAFNNTSESYLVSSISVVFYVDEKEINPEYLFMFFNRPEFDRYSRYNSFGSAREPFNWEDMCDIEIELPDIDTQLKFINVYLSMLENQKSYEHGLDDLKLVCDAYIEDLRRKMSCEEIGPYIKERSEKNNDSKITNVLGISKEGFIDPRANMEGVSITNYNVFYKDDFVYSPPRINVGSIGLYKEDTVSICSPIYKVFYINDTNKLIPDYLMLWFKRSEFLRSTDFYSIGSVRNNFDMDCMTEVKIPIPSIEVQQTIVNIFKCYLERKEINEKLKAQIKNICPILIKGAIEEAKENNYV